MDVGKKETGTALEDDLREMTQQTFKHGLTV